jgi:cleavage and polyadenylation specificity factor subunit 4
MANVLAGPSSLKDLVKPEFHQFNFPAEKYIKNELGIKLDKGKCPFACNFTS